MHHSRWDIRRWSSWDGSSWEWMAAASLGLWAASAARLRFAKRTRWLEESAPAPDEECPTLSIVVPACNESDTVEPAMRSLLALDYPHLQIIAVDDRSTDTTGSILDRLAALDPRLSAIHITELPVGWLGKNHALQKGADASASEYILFTDADVLYSPNALRCAARLVRAERVDHLALAPGVILHGFWERLLVSYFVVLFTLRFRPWDVENPRSRAYIGIGAFNLVRRTAYEAAGGHHRLRMDVADDIKLGKVLKQAGYHQLIAYGADLVRVRWVVGATGFVNGLTKNMFGGLDYQWRQVMGITFLLGAFSIGPGIGLFRSGATRLLSAAALLAMVVCAQSPELPSGTPISPRRRQALRELSPSPLYGLLYPAAAALYIYTVWRSAVRAEREGGIRWRGTFYPLSDLRSSLV